MTWIITASGAEVDLRRPTAGSISALDIAHALAQINRFTGHTARPYSVAEHSLLVLDLLEREFAVRAPAARLAALLHDAHEAYCGDVSTPVKQAIGWMWSDFEQPLQNHVLHRFGVLRAAREYASLIKTCDLMALAIERRDLLPTPGADSRAWALLEGISAPGWVDLTTGHHSTYAWGDWRDVFIEKFGELHFATHGAGLATAAEASA
jgi:hypothetical protein